MSRLYEAFFQQHDLRFVALAIGICALASLTSVAVAQYAMTDEQKLSRSKWLVLAGLVTGFGIWTTHFTALLGYRSDLQIHFDLSAAIVSIMSACAFATAGWLFGFVRTERPVFAGTMFGVGIAAAHYIDMHEWWRMIFHPRTQR